MPDRLDQTLLPEEFSTQVAQALRTSQTRIRGELDLILRNEVPDPPRRQLESIRDELERLSRLCRRVFLLLRLEGQVRDGCLPDERVDLSEVVSELVEQMTPFARDRGVGIRTGDMASAPVRGSRPLLVEAVFILLERATRSTPEGGLVTVSTDASVDGAQVLVEDDAPAVAPAERERIFQPFHKIPGSPPGAESGTGLGLAIVKGVARAHGGRVELLDAPRGGNLFRLKLPALRP